MVKQRKQTALAFKKIGSGSVCIKSFWRNKFRPATAVFAGSNLLVPGALTGIRPDAN
jgi:hypothetical protein